MTKKLVVLAVVAAAVVAYFQFDLGNTFSFENLKAQQDRLQSFREAHPVGAFAGFIGIYIVMAALSLPGATIMTLAAGFIFGLLPGLVAVSIASTIGATLAFLFARYVLRDSIQRKFGARLETINEGIRREGALYLFTLRLIPIFPFFVINLVFGLTTLKTWTFAWVSQVGMLVGTAVYVNAGTQLGQLESLSGILSPGLLGAFVLLGLFPLIVKRVMIALKARKALARFDRPQEFDYNVVVIGAGSGGLVTSLIAAAVNAKVALVEKHKMGGDCLNTGCVPSKALIRSAKMLHYARRAEDWGFRSTKVDFDFAEVMERVQGVIRKIEPHDSVERYEGLGVECIQGEARILDPYRVRVGERVLTTRNIVVATGAGPLLPSIPGLEEVEPLTSDTLWDIRKLPRRLVVVGGGPIGSEITQAMRRFGSEVTQVESAPQIMSREDADVSALIRSRFEEEGIRVLTGHRVVEFRREGDTKVVLCKTADGEVRLECDEILIALGRRANVKGFGLEELGVEITQRGTVAVDEFLRTNFPNIYACGDVAGPYQFTHYAAHQAWYAAVNALFSPLKSFKLDDRVVPWTTFTDPEVARVGLNEAEAKAKGIEVQVTRYGMDDLDRAIADGEDYGMVKVLTPPGKDRILGVTIVGSHAGDILTEYVAAMKHGFGLNKILGTIHVYPTMGEANKYAAGVWKNANKPEGVLRFLRRFHGWRRSTRTERRVRLGLLAGGAVLAAAALVGLRFFTASAHTPEPGKQPAVLFQSVEVDRLARALAAHVDSEGLVDYVGFAKDREDLDAYYRSVAYLDADVYEGWDEPRRIAFWCNVYNALTLAVVLENHPIGRSVFGTSIGAPEGSIKQIPDVWNRAQFLVMGETVTLGHIEHEILRKEFDEPRIHVAINCASGGCPPLRAEPFRGRDLEAQLEDQTKRFLGEASRFHIDREADVVGLSAIFSWFGGDFEAGYLPTAGFGDHSDPVRSVLAFIAEHVSEADAEFLREGAYEVRFLPYDWSLNEQVTGA